MVSRGYSILPVKTSEEGFVLMRAAILPRAETILVLVANCDVLFVKLQWVACFILVVLRRLSEMMISCLYRFDSVVFSL